MGIVAAEAAKPAHLIAGQPLLTVQGLKKHFPIYGGVLRKQIGTVYAVDGVDFEIMPGETFSLVGESGCGKTTLGRTVIQLTPSTDGRVVFDGYELADADPDDMRPLRRRMQIIFQDPFGSLNPRMPVSDIIGEGLLAQGLTDRAARDKRVEDSLELVGLRREYTRRYPHEFSGGQRQRIGVARALALGPDFIVADEPVSALDVSIQSQVLNLLLDLKRELNLTYLFISHNLSVVQYFSDRVGVMYLGKIVEIGSVDQLYRDPRHPYTVALLSAIPEANPRRRKSRHRAQGRRPVARGAAVRLPVPHPVLAARAAGQPRELLDDRAAAAAVRAGGPPGRVPLGRGAQRDHRVAGGGRVPGDRPGGPRRRVTRAGLPRYAPDVRRLLVSAFLLALATAACGSSSASPTRAPASPPSASPPPSIAPRASRSPDAAQPSPSPWPRGVIEGLLVLGTADKDIQNAGADFGTATQNEDLAAMWGAADGLAAVLGQLPAQVDRIRDNPEAGELAAIYDDALPKMTDGARGVRDAITAGNADGIASSSRTLAAGLVRYADARELLAPLVERAFFMQRVLVK